jgi:hypothetical protein
MVFGRADLQHIAFVHGIVHGLRAPARSRVAQDAQHISVGFTRVVAQRILADQAAWQKHIDV